MATPKGRTIRKDEPEQQRPFAAQPGVPPPPGGTPFGGFGPDAKSMYAAAEENREKSVSILVIVGGVIFAIVSALIIALAMLLLLLVYRQTQQGGEVAVKDDPLQHVRDTGFADPLQPRPDRPGPRPGAGPGPDGDKSVRDPSLGPPPGPVTVIVPTEMLFQSIEVNCPSGFRDRGTLRKESKTTERGTVYNVPGGERCTITFQGSEPAKSWVSANDTLSCTFNPVVCRKL